MTLHFPLIIAVLALLAFALLPVLDRSASSADTEGIRSYVTRIARWAKE